MVALLDEMEQWAQGPMSHLNKAALEFAGETELESKGENGIELPIDNHA